MAHAASGRDRIEAEVDLARLDAIRRYRAEASRETSRLLRELRSPRAEAAAAEPRNEPGPDTAPDLTLDKRVKVELMLASGDPVLIVEGARRAGVLHAVPGAVRRRAAALPGCGALAPARGARVRSAA